LKLNGLQLFFVAPRGKAGREMKRTYWLAGSLVVALARIAPAQTAAHVSDWSSFPAAPGYEAPLMDNLKSRFKDFSPTIDNVGNLIVTVGAGEPHRLIATAVDHPGYVVSGITPDGFLRVQRLPQAAPNPVFDSLHFAQPALIVTREKKSVNGVFAGLSVHLQPGRQDAPKMNHPDEMYLDIGATSTEEVRAAGVDVLDQVALNEQPTDLGGDFFEVAGPAVGDRFGTAALSELLYKMKETKPSGTTTIAFLTQGWAGGRGLNRLLEQLRPAEMVYLGRISGEAAKVATPADGNSNPQLGKGVLLAVEKPVAPLQGFPAEIQALAKNRGLRLTPSAGRPPRIAGYDKPNALPERFAQLGVATLWPVTPAETVSLKDLGDLEQLLEAYVGISRPLTKPEHGGVAGREKQVSAVEGLTETYGASGHEGDVRDAIKKWLFQHGRLAPETDSAGNLILHFGTAKPDSKVPKIAFVAHMDELGYEVRSVEPDGTLLADVLGGGYQEYFLGHTALVHTSGGGTKGGVVELPNGWDQPNFEWPRGGKMMSEPVRVYVGTHSAEETQKLGIKAGDWLTIRKDYRPLLGTHANARSFDDRAGCAALITAAATLGKDVPGRDVTFIWSTEEEVGLKGAAAAAERLAKEGKAPDFVFAIDTFVSADSPLESKRFGYAEIGKGLVIRAIDNSNIAPREYVDRVIKLARDNNIPVQYGVTGGGNDGAVFQRYGSVDIPLGWPLRYAHSPGEVIDTRDLDALANIVAVLAKEW
jgi:putative aminopeptidase